MKKWFASLTLAFLVASLGLNVYLIRPYIGSTELYQCDDSEFVVYRPVYYNLKRSRPIESPFIIDTSNVDESHYNKIQFVLKYHRLNFKVESGKVLIERTLWEDKDYVANLTQKANDPKWLNEKHYVEK